MLLRADVVVCPFYVREQSFSIVDFGVNYFKAQSTLIVPRPKVSDFHWNSIFQGIRNEVWMWTGILMATIYAILLICQYFSTKTLNSYPKSSHLMPVDIFFELFSIILTSNSIKLYTVPGLTRILRIWSFFAFFMGIMYSTDLIKFLTLTQYTKSIKTPQDFFESNLNWSLKYKFDLSTNIKEEFIEPLEKKFTLWHGTKSKLMAEIGRGKLGIFSILRDGVPFPVSIAIKDIPPEIVRNLQVMKEHFYTGSIAPVYRKNSPYKSKMEEILMYVVNVGLLENIKTTEMRKQFPTLWSSVTADRKNENTVKTLSIDQIYGAILILLIGYGMSSIILIFELMLSKILKYKKTSITASRNIQ